MIICKLSRDGSFTAADSVTGKTAYAYPTSDRARQAKRRPMATAAEMLGADGRGNATVAREYDRLNWNQLNSTN